MIAHVVPVTRIRRDTASWSYTLPAGSRVTAGSLVVVPFAGRECLGVVWEISEQDDKASKAVSRVLCPQPFIKAPQRHFIEYLSRAGLCSLSTALYVWMPRSLRGWPLRVAALKLVTAYAPQEHIAPQHCVLVPGKRPDQEELLAAKFNGSFGRLYGDANETEELEDWFKVLRGEIRVGLGRERALFAPWGNLQQLTVIEPEDIFYYHEQVPYLSLSEAAWELAGLTNSRTAARTALPTSAAALLWPNAAGLESPPARLSFTDLRKEPLINDVLLAAIRDTLLLGQKVLLFYNAHDRLRSRTKEGLTASVLIPGIESLARQLAAALGRTELGPEIAIGTRAFFDQPRADIGLTVALSLDPLLDTELFADQLHGLSDLGHLFSYGCPCLIQAYRQEHPLLEALRGGRLAEYVSALIEEHREHALPPFGQQLVLSYPEKEGSRELVDAVVARLAPLIEEPWQLGRPLAAAWHKKRYWHIMLDAPDPAQRLPTAVRKLAVSLPSPWKAMRNPAYLI